MWHRVADYLHHVWGGTLAQWIYLGVLLAAVLGIVASLTAALWQARAERQLLRAVLAMARVGDAAPPHGRQGGTGALAAEAASTVPAEAAPSSQRWSDAATAAARTTARGQPSVGELGDGGKGRLTAGGLGGSGGGVRG